MAINIPNPQRNNLNSIYAAVPPATIAPSPPPKMKPIKAITNTITIAVPIILKLLKMCYLQRYTVSLYPIYLSY